MNTTTADNFLADAYAVLPVAEKLWVCGICGERFATPFEHNPQECDGGAPAFTEAEVKKFKNLQHLAEQARYARESYQWADGRTAGRQVVAKAQAKQTHQGRFDQAWEALTLDELRRFGEWRKTL